MRLLILIGAGAAISVWIFGNWRRDRAKGQPDLTHRRASKAWSGTEWRGL